MGFSPVHDLTNHAALHTIQEVLALSAQQTLMSLQIQRCRKVLDASASCLYMASPISYHVVNDCCQDRFISSTHPG